jgi:hypothetical protein
MQWTKHRWCTLTLLAGFLAALASAPAQAETWTGSCHKVMFHFDRVQKTKVFYLSLITDAGIWPVAQGDIVYESDVSLRANIQGNRNGFKGQPYTEIVINKDKKQILVLRRDEKTGEIKDGVFGATEVQIRDDTWIGACNNLQFTFNRKTKIFLLHFKTDAGTFEMARGKVVFDNNIAVSAAITGAPQGAMGKTITEIGINKDRNIIYVQYCDPNTGKVTSGTFGKTEVEVRK